MNYRLIQEKLVLNRFGCFSILPHYAVLLLVNLALSSQLLPEISSFLSPPSSSVRLGILLKLNTASYWPFLGYNVSIRVLIHDRHFPL